jgi:hypothetical protein
MFWAVSLSDLFRLTPVGSVVMVEVSAVFAVVATKSIEAIIDRYGFLLPPSLSLSLSLDGDHFRSFLFLLYFTMLASKTALYLKYVYFILQKQTYRWCAKSYHCYKLESQISHRRIRKAKRS